MFAAFSDGTHETNNESDTCRFSIPDSELVHGWIFDWCWSYFSILYACVYYVGHLFLRNLVGVCLFAGNLVKRTIWLCSVLARHRNL